MTTPALQLGLWLQKRLVAEISYLPTEEQWSLRYSADWRSDSQAFPLSPALSLEQDISSSAIRRFLENLLPEGHALDIVASSQGIAKSNIFALIRALGSETTGAFRCLPAGVDGTAEQPGSELRPISVAELGAGRNIAYAPAGAGRHQV